MSKTPTTESSLLPTSSSLTEPKAAPLEVTAAARELIKAECDKQGCTLEYLIGRLKIGTTATKTVTNKFGEFRDDEDYIAQHKNVMSLLELRGELKVKDEVSTTVNVLDVKNILQMWNSIPSPTRFNE